jgi:malate permease and related proteins
VTFLNPNLVQPILTVLCLVGVGILCRVIGVINDAGQRQLTSLVMKVFVPVMLFMAGLRSDPASLAREGAPVFLAGLVFPFMGYGIGVIVTRILRLPAAQSSVIRVSAALCNTAFVGIPVCTALWGPQGAILAAVYDQALNIPLLTIAPLEYGRAAGRTPWRSLLLEPLLWGLILGVAARVMGLSLPAWTAAPLSMMSAATLPLSLILVGSLAVPRQMSWNMARPLAAFVGTRLVLVPLAALSIVWLLGLRGIGSGVMVLQTAMPASVLATVMAKEYNADADLAAAGALLTILLSALTLPLLTALLFQRGL